MTPDKFYRDQPPLPRQRIFWDKIGYNSVYIRDIRAIFAYNGEFSGSGYWIMSHKYYHNRPWLSWLRNLRQNRL